MDYSHLEHRAHPWRKQLSFKGRRLTVGQFLNAMRTEGWTLEKTAQDFDLPIEAAYDAIEYGERHAALLEAEDEIERRAAVSATS